MESNLNFNHFGGEQSAAAGRGHNNMPLTRQTSIYSLTFDELQNSMGGSLGGKDFGSMNMDELLKNIWTAEESQALAAATAVGLQRQGSLTLPRTVTHKTVDEIWKDMSSKDGGGASASGAGFPKKQPTLGEITLEEFLVRAGVVREDASTTQTTNGVGFYYDLMMRNNNNTAAAMSSRYGGFGFPQDGFMTNNSNNNQMMMQSSKLPLNVNGARSSHQLSLAPSQPQPLFPKQPGMSYGNPLGLSGGAQLASPRMRGGLVGIADPGLMRGGAGLSMTGVGAATITAASGSPAQLSSDGLGNSYGDLSSLSPVPYMFNGGVKGRKANGAVEKVVERRQRRMIKNRESAARSRARKQAYTMELEAEVAKLKEENQELQKKQAEIMEMQKNQIQSLSAFDKNESCNAKLSQVLEMMNNQGGDKRQRLRRTQTGLW